MKRSPVRLALFTASVLVGACADHKKPAAPQAPAPAATSQPPLPPVAQAPTPAPPPTAPRRPGTPTLGDGIQWFRTSAEYRALTMSTYRAATEAVTAAAKGKARDSWAVVLDADETVLDNSAFQRDLAKDTAPFTEELWATFVHQRSSVPIPGAKDFLDRVKELGGRIAIVTNRFDVLCDDTRENFRMEKLPFDVILCRVGGSDKDPRLESAATGLGFGDNKAREVVAFVGDNIQDFPTLKQSLRDAPDSAFDAFGKKYFILPNPMYGSWQQNKPR